MSKLIKQSFSFIAIPGIAALLIILGQSSLTPVSDAQLIDPGDARKSNISHSAPGLPAAAPALIFEANQGQSDEKVKFISKGKNYTLFLLEDSALFSLQARSASGELTTSFVEMRMPGSSLTGGIHGVGRLASQGHYFKGNGVARGHTHIPHFAAVEYKAVYPGIDLKYYQRDAHLEYDFIVAPYADPGRIQIAFPGAESLMLDASGNLVIRTSTGQLVQHAPYAYQEDGDSQQHIPSAYHLSGNSVSFQLAAYDSSRPLVIDPGLAYASYLGGSQGDEAHSIAVDSAGNFYVTGWTQSADFPSLNALFSKPGGASDVDAFVAKYDRHGNLAFVTYLGGTGLLGDRGYGIAVDTAGKIYVTGEAASDVSQPFPTTSGAYNGTPQGNLDVFVSVLSNDGASLLYSSLLGGGLGDRGEAIAVDSSGNVHVAGTTYSETAVPGDGFPVKNAYQSTADGAPNFPDAFVFKLNPAGNGASDLLYSTYLSGGGIDEGHDIALDASGAAYVTGNTNSIDFPVVAPYQATLAGATDAFFIKLDSAGAPVYASYLGGSGVESGMALTVDATGNVYVAGQTGSSNFPVINSNHNTLKGATDAYLAMLDSAGASLGYSAYLGGNGAEEATGVAIDHAGDIFLTGYSSSPDFPVNNSTSGYSGGGSDLFLTQVDTGSDSYPWSLLHGGSLTEQGRDLAMGPAGQSAYVSGWTRSSDFAVSTGSQQQTSAGGVSDAFVFKAGDVADLTVSITDSDVTVGAILSYTVTVTNQGPDGATGVIAEATLPAGVSFDSADSGCAASGAVVSCDLGTILAGEFASVTIDALIETASEVTTVANVNSNAHDLTAANNSDSVMTLAGPAANDGAPILIGDGVPGHANGAGKGGVDLLLIIALGGWFLPLACRKGGGLTAKQALKHMIL